VSCRPVGRFWCHRCILSRMLATRLYKIQLERF
jgi:hypothetical protein